MVADAQLRASALSDGDHPLGVGGGATNGFFSHQVFTGLQRADKNVRPQIIADGGDDKEEFFVRQQLVKIGKGSADFGRLFGNRPVQRRLALVPQQNFADFGQGLQGT